MIRAMNPAMKPLRVSRQSGVGLIELMIAMILGLLVAAGIISAFVSTSSSNRAQTQLATLQEEGRFAIYQIKTDLSAANGQYCSNSGGDAQQPNGNPAVPYLDGLRVPTVYANNAVAVQSAFSDDTTLWGATQNANTYPAAPTSPYSLPSFLAMRGYDCGLTSASCTPIDPNKVAVGIPPMGKLIGNRMPGTAVLTMRYLDPSKGWAITPGQSTLTTSASGTLLTINLNPVPNVEPPVTAFLPGNFALLTDCSYGQIFAVAGQGTNALQPTGANFAQPTASPNMAAAKVFDFNTDYKTVTYYLQLVDNGSGAPIGALIRNVNGVPSELVRGIERLDFKYGIQYSDGTTKFLTAADVDNSSKADCPPSVPIPIGGSNDPGCLWHAVKSVEVDLLMDGQVPLYTLTGTETYYGYSSDTGTAAIAAPAAHAVTPTAQGLPDQMLRREFTALVSVRNFNP